MNLGFELDKWYRFRNCDDMCDFANEATINEKIIKRVNLQPFRVMKAEQGHAYEISVLEADFETKRLDITDIDSNHMPACCILSGSERKYFEDIAAPQETTEDDYGIDTSESDYAVMVSTGNGISTYVLLSKNYSYDAAVRRAHQYLTEHPSGRVMIFNGAELYTAKETVQITKTEF